MSTDLTDAAQPEPGAPPTGMPLDARQRAMLEAMGITLWQPGIFDEKQAVVHVNRTQAAIQTVAPTNPLAMPVRAAQPVAIPPPPPTSAATAQRASAAPSPIVSAPVAANPASPATVFTSQPLPAGIAQMDWPALQSAVRSCQACALCASRKTTVFGTGQSAIAPALAPRADWLIVGEAPSEDEDAQGEPFAGPAGKLLDNMLRAMVINGQPLARQSNVFITNVLKCRPPADRNPSSAEVARCQPYLLRQIELLQPKIILAMGRFAMQALIGSTEPVGKLRGRVHLLQGASTPTNVIVTYHPGYLLRNPADKAKAWADLLLAMETLQSTNVG
jgi:uracil-DNA glycosylase